MNEPVKKQEPRPYIYQLKPVREIPEEAVDFLSKIGELLDNEVIDEEDYEKFFTQHVKLNHEKKFDYIISKMRDNIDTINALKNEKEHLTARIKLFENENKNIKRTIGWWLKKLGIRKLKTALESVYLKKGGGRGLIMPGGYDSYKVNGAFSEDSGFAKDLLKNHRSLFNEISTSGICGFSEILTFDKTALSKFIRENPEKIDGTPLADITFTEEKESLVVSGLR